MSIKIKVSYTEEAEERMMMTLLQPILGRFKVKRTEGTSPYKHLYFVPKKPENH